MKIGIIIQARTNSTRLPSKVLLPFYKEKSILDILIENFKSVERYPIILATSNNKNDFILKEYANKYKINFFIGKENDVLDRFINAASEFNLDTIFRVCSDNPFFDINSLFDLEKIYRRKDNIDYCSFKNSLGTPVIKTHIGMFGEIVSVEALNKVKRLTNKKEYLEHVTNYIYEHPKRFNIYLENSPPKVYDRNDLRFTVDDHEDFENLKRVYGTYIDNNLDMNGLIDFVDTNKNIIEKMKRNIKKYSK